MQGRPLQPRLRAAVPPDPTPTRPADVPSERPLRPRALAPGSRVALVAPAGPLDPERIERSRVRCRGMGLEPVVFPSAAERTGFLAGSDAARLRDLQAAFDDEAIDAVWALRGGYGTQRIVDGLVLDRLRRDPIPFLGFSDLTALHVRLGSMGVVSFHAPHPGGAFPPETEAHLRRVLFHAGPPGPLPTRPEDPPPRPLVEGVAEGPLTGGNLALLSSLCGTRDAPAARGAILVLEEVGEPAYRVDRMLLQLHRSGALDGVAGLALGRFTGRDDDEEGEERAVAAVLAEWAGRMGVPAVRDLPFGHVAHNCTLPLGVRARLDGARAALDLLEPAVRPT